MEIIPQKQEIVNKDLLTLEDRIIKINSIIRTISNRDKNEPIPLDTNILNCNEFLEKTFFCRDYSQIKTEDLEEVLKSIEFTQDLLENNNMIITENVLKEINWFSDLFLERIKFFNNVDRRSDKRYKDSERLELKKEICNSTNLLCLNINKRLKKLTYHPEDRETYKVLFDYVCILTRELNLKPNKNRYLIAKKYRREKISYLADEEIVSTSVYLSFKGKSCSIISTDPDIRKILIPTVSFLKSEFMKEQGFKPLLEKNIISFYNPVNSWVNEASAKPSITSDIIYSTFKREHEKKLFG